MACLAERDSSRALSRLGVHQTNCCIHQSHSLLRSLVVCRFSSRPIQSASFLHPTYGSFIHSVFNRQARRRFRDAYHADVSFLLLFFVNRHLRGTSTCIVRLRARDTREGRDPEG